MNVVCVPVDEGIIELEFQHKLPEAGLNYGFRFIRAVCTWRKDAQGIGSASVHDV